MLRSLLLSRRFWFGRKPTQTHTLSADYCLRFITEQIESTEMRTNEMHIVRTLTLVESAKILKTFSLFQALDEIEQERKCRRTHISITCWRWNDWKKKHVVTLSPWWANGFWLEFINLKILFGKWTKIVWFELKVFLLRHLSFHNANFTMPFIFYFRLRYPDWHHFLGR